MTGCRCVFIPYPQSFCWLTFVGETVSTQFLLLTPLFRFFFPFGICEYFSGLLRRFLSPGTNSVDNPFSMKQNFFVPASVVSSILDSLKSLPVPASQSFFFFFPFLSQIFFTLFSKSHRVATLILLFRFLSLFFQRRAHSAWVIPPKFLFSFPK